MAVNGRAKGAEFERLIAKMIYKAAGMGPKDCARTPMSGGHHMLGSGDLMFSDRLYQIIPFTIECKHHKTWSPGRMLNVTDQELGWVDQVTEASKGVVPPMLIMRGNNTPIYAATLLNDMREHFEPLPTGCDRVIFYLERDKVVEPWVMLRFDLVLDVIATKAKEQ